MVAVALLSVINVKIFRSFVHYIVLFFFGSFLLLCIVDVVFIVLAGIEIYKFSVMSNMSENTRFILEKERFWMYVELFGVVLVTMPIEFITWLWDEVSFDAMMVSDFIKCFSAGIIFCIFVMKKNVRCLLSDRYGSLKNGHETLATE